MPMIKGDGDSSPWGALWESGSRLEMLEVFERS